MLTREDPYGGLPPFQVVVQVATKGLRPDIPPNCPKAWHQLMIDCWAEDEITRPTFQDIVDRLSSMTLEDAVEDELPRTGTPAKFRSPAGSPGKHNLPLGAVVSGSPKPSPPNLRAPAEPHYKVLHASDPNSNTSSVQ